MNRKHRKTRISTVRAGISPTKERRNRNGGVRSEATDQDVAGQILVKRYRAVCECLLDMYHETGLLTANEYMSGLKFRHHYYRAVLRKSALRQRWTYTSEPLTPTVSELTLKAASRILSPYNMGIIIDICGHDLPVRDGKDVHSLKNGLGRLALHWGIAATEVTGRARKTI